MVKTLITTSVSTTSSISFGYSLGYNRTYNYGYNQKNYNTGVFAPCSFLTCFFNQSVCIYRSSIFPTDFPEMDNMHVFPHWLQAGDNQQPILDPEIDDQPPNLEPMEIDDQSPNIVQDNVEHFYVLGEPAVQHVRRFNTTAATYPLHFRNLNQVSNFHEILPEIFLIASLIE